MADRIKHDLPLARWPSADEAARSRLFSTITIGSLEVQSRTWVPAMVPWRATDDGFVTPNVLDWYGRFADGQPGVLVVEATGIRDVPSGPLLRIGHERFVPGLRDLCATVRQRSNGQTKLFLQILDFLSIRRRPEKDKFFARFLVITARHRDAVRERYGDAAAADDKSVRAQLGQCDDDTLRKHYAQELAHGKAKVTAQVANALVKKALSDRTDSVNAAKFYLQSQAGWKERSEQEQSGAVKVINEIVLRGVRSQPHD